MLKKRAPGSSMMKLINSDRSRGLPKSFVFTEKYSTIRLAIRCFTSSEDSLCVRSIYKVPARSKVSTTTPIRQFLPKNVRGYWQKHGNLVVMVQPCPCPAVTLALILLARAYLLFVTVKIVSAYSIMSVSIAPINWYQVQGACLRLYAQ